jgi:uronate dehydrogenase
MAKLLRLRLARPGRILRLLDIAEIPHGEDGAEIFQASITDLSAMEAACAEVDVLLHLGGLSTEHEWAKILETNIHGSYVTLEAARRCGVQRAILASSNHAIGYIGTQTGEIDAAAFPRPDTNYGVGKVALEALGSLYADRYGMDVIAIRIGSCFERPQNARMLHTWLSPDDAARLIEACIAAPVPGFRVIWGASNNTRPWVSLAGARALGYAPQDDAERFAAELLAEQDEIDSDPHLLRYVGGTWCGPDWNTAEKERSS